MADKRRATPSLTPVTAQLPKHHKTKGLKKHERAARTGITGCGGGRAAAEGCWFDPPEHGKQTPPLPHIRILFMDFSSALHKADPHALV